MSDIVEMPACATKRKYSPIWNYFDKSTTGTYSNFAHWTFLAPTAELRQLGSIWKESTRKIRRISEGKRRIRLGKKRKIHKTGLRKILKNYILFYINFKNEKHVQKFI